jgi:hypothetical protein
MAKAQISPSKKGSDQDIDIFSPRNDSPSSNSEDDHLTIPRPVLAPPPSVSTTVPENSANISLSRPTLPRNIPKELPKISEKRKGPISKNLRPKELSELAIALTTPLTLPPLASASSTSVETKLSQNTSTPKTPSHPKSSKPLALTKKLPEAFHSDSSTRFSGSRSHTSSPYTVASPTAPTTSRPSDKLPDIFNHSTSATRPKKSPSRTSAARLSEQESQQFFKI